MENLKRLLEELRSLGTRAVQHLKLLGIAILATLYIVSIFKTKEQKKLSEEFDAPQVMMLEEFNDLQTMIPEGNGSLLENLDALKTPETNNSVTVEEDLSKTRRLLFSCKNRLRHCKPFKKHISHHNESEELPSHENRNKPSLPKGLARINLTV